MRLPPTTTLLPYTTLFRSAPSETGAGSEIGSENPPGSAEFPVTPVSSAVGGSPYMARPGQSSHLEQHGHEGPNVHETDLCVGPPCGDVVVIHVEADDGRDRPEGLVHDG